MKEYIEKGALYNKTAEWEANALKYIKKLQRKPLAEISEAEKVEWFKWQAILGERSAFKFDVADAPAADVRENIHGMWIIDEDGNIECNVCGHHGVGDLYCERCGTRMDERDERDEE